MISVRLPEALLDALDAATERLGLESRTAGIEQGIELLLQKSASD